MHEPVNTFDPCEALTVKAVAKLLSVSEPTVRAYIRRGLLPSALIGRCRRIRRIDLEGFLKQQTAYGWQRYRRESSTPDTDESPGHPCPAEAGSGDIPF